MENKFNQISKILDKIDSSLKWKITKNNQFKNICIIGFGPWSQTTYFPIFYGSENVSKKEMDEGVSKESFSKDIGLQLKLIIDLESKSENLKTFFEKNGFKQTQNNKQELTTVWSRDNEMFELYLIPKLDNNVKK